jgi:hypothetical protein
MYFRKKLGRNKQQCRNWRIAEAGILRNAIISPLTPTGFSLRAVMQKLADIGINDPVAYISIEQLPPFIEYQRWAAMNVIIIFCFVFDMQSGMSLP